MAKRLTYLAESDRRAWPPHFYETAAQTTGLNFIMGASDDGPHPKVNVTNLGLLEQPNFLKAISQSKILVGVGLPFLSPTPYEALCLGVPFINPIIDWDHDAPEDRSRWDTQHGLLKRLDPPYVYHVFKDDLQGFIKAIESAIANPIDSFVLDRMRLTSIATRLHGFLQTNWKSKASELLDQWEHTGEGPMFEL